MKIAIDIDDTLARYQKGFLEYHNKKYGTSLSETEVNAYDYSAQLGLQSAEELSKRMLDFSTTEEFNKLQPLKHSQAVVTQLSQNNELFIVTSRPEYMKMPSIMWVEEHFQSLFSDFFFTNQFGAKPGATITTKGEICAALDASMLIEDSFKYANEAIDNGVRAILLNKPWNIQEENKKIERVNNWVDIKKLIIV